MDFFELVKTGTPQNVHAAISNGTDVNTPNEFGSTPLMLAAWENPDREVITVLLKAHAGVKAQNNNGWTALMFAANKNQNPLVTITLLKARADIKAQNNNGWTALMFAASTNPNSEVITALLKAGADIKARNNDGMTPLMLAARENLNPDVIAVLLKAGSDIKAQSKYGSTPLMLAARENPNSEVITVLLKAGADIKARNNDGMTPLMLAARENPNRDVITLLLKAGTDVNARDMDDWTALMFAARYSQNPDVITLLLKAGADIKARNNDGLTVLMLAACNEKLEVITMLLKAGVDIKAQSKYSSTPLMLAAKENPNSEVITALLKAGADIEARNNDGLTPLMIAARHNLNSEVIAALLKAGANAEEKDNSGRIAFDYAQGNEKLKGTDAYSKLEKASDVEHSQTYFFELAKTGMPLDVQATIDQGVDVNAQNTAGVTLLMAAAEANPNPEVITTLLKAGADAKAKDNSGKTAFEYAQNNDRLKGTNAYWELRVKVASSPEVEKSLSDKLSEGMNFLNSDGFYQEVEKAKRARDQASADEWKRRGSPGIGQKHSCHMCHNTTYGEETVIRLQNEALNILEAQRIEQRSAYRCKSCGKEFCKDCLEKKAPSNAFGGKSCPRCNGLFEIIHG